jgi:uncharacterized protein YjbI with pentapeptide repeats
VNEKGIRNLLTTLVAMSFNLDYTLPAMAHPEHLALARRYAAGDRNLRLEMLDLVGADLSGLDFSEAWLRDTRLCEANLRGCRFVGAPMPGTDLSGADLTGADLHGAIAAGAIFCRAILSEASLRAADLYGADLSHANLTRADLTQADLSLVVANHTNFAEAQLSRAILFGTNLDQVENMSQAKFHRAQLPAGFQPSNNPRRSRFARGFFGGKKS